MRTNFSYIIVAIFLITVKGYTAEISNFDILDLKLGMTMNEVKKKYPSMDIEIIKHWGTDEILYYKGIIEPSKFNNWEISSLFFSSFRDGKRLYKLGVEQFVGKNVLKEVKNKVIEKYGEPHCSAENYNGSSIEFKWGNCSTYDNFLEHTTSGKYFRFLYDKAQMYILMEDINMSKKINLFVLTLDEETKLKEVLEMDF